MTALSAQVRFSEVCAITVCKANQKQDEGTCSGIVVDSKRGLILTHASVLVSLFPKNAHIFHKIKKIGHCANAGELSTLNAEVCLQPSELASTSRHRGYSLSRYQPTLLNCNLQRSESQPPCVKWPADVLGVFRCDSLRTILTKLVPHDTWHFQEDLGSNSQSDERKPDKNLEEDQNFYFLLPCFVLLKLQDWLGYDSVLPLRASVDNRLGDRVEICATPFGIMNPEVFLNSRSHGVVSNLAGAKQVLLLTDARCIPGSEGGAVYYIDGQNRYLTGIVIASLCWKNNEWVGLSLACSISEVVQCMKDFHTRSPEWPISLTSLKVNNVESASSKSGRLFPEMKVPLLSVGGMWGSGIIVCPEQGLILTCSHVIKGSENSRVRVIIQPNQKFLTAEVLYRTPQNSHFDVALLSVPPSCLPPDCLVPEIDTPVEGDQTYVIGHALFGHDHGLDPTVTSGIVSKVIKVNNTPIMLQTTCAVHPGASGGPVMNGDGKLVGLVVCNSKDTASGACYPHINMSIPVETIAPVIAEYIRSEDPHVLNDLHIHNETVKRVWSLGNTQPAKQSLPFSKI